MFQTFIKKENSIIIFIGFIFYFLIKYFSESFIINVFFVMCYFSLFSIFYVFIKNNIRNFFISLPILIILIYINLIIFLDCDWWIPEFEMTYLILMLIPIFSFLAYIFKEKNIRNFFLSLATIIITTHINLLGVFDYEWWWYILEMIHLFLIFVSLLALLIYIFKGRYLWWVIFSPVVPMIIMYILKEFYPCLKPVGLGAV